MQSEFLRLLPLFGEPALERFAGLKVILFGVGGVGSWCAEALVRSGISNLTLVDSDMVVASNINRQLPAEASTVGEPKAEVLARRLNALRPGVRAEPVVSLYEPGDAAKFGLQNFDAVIDAIDSLKPKIDLLVSASQAGAAVFSSMGAAGRLDPTLVRHGSIWDTGGCPLAKKIRAALRQQNFGGDFEAVYSLEKPRPHYVAKPEPGSSRPSLGSAMPVTAAFGMALASLVLKKFSGVQ